MSASALGGTIVVVTILVSRDDPAQIAASISLLVVAASAGWLIGMFISPCSSKEKQEFSEYSKLVSTALGGYFVGKFDSIFSNLTKADFDPLLVVRATGALSIFIISMVIVFYFRRYAM
jgi:hypothetical protein